MKNLLCKWFGRYCPAPVAESPKVEEPGIPPSSDPNALCDKWLFPKQEWANHVWNLVEDMPLVRDSEIFPSGMTRQRWVYVFAAMAKNESNFKPELTYKENFKNSRGEYVISTGLFQLSYESARGYGFNVTTEDLKDPFKNIEVAVKIMKTLVKRDGVITGKRLGSWLGAARYWSVFRSGKVQATLKSLPK